MRRDVFQAIADPVRRKIIALLSEQALTVNAVATHFDISRPAVSKHLRILDECGVIQMTQNGRERVCFIQPKELMTVADWLAQYQKLWEGKLDSFENYLQEIQSKNE